jgi:hypothetical protein
MAENERFTATTKQTTKYKKYEAKCDRDNCPNGDWCYGNTTARCFPGLNRCKCSKVYVGTCPGPVITAFWSSQNNNPNTKALVDCSYQTRDFTSSKTVTEYINKFGRDNNWARSIMPFFCGLQTSQCPIDQTTGQPMSSCSNLVSTGDNGTLCRQWTSTVPAQIVDQTKSNYCRQFNTPDCKCINRTESQIYRDVSAGYPFPDSCWWIPCRNSDAFLVPSNLLNPQCPSEVCTIVNNTINNRNTNINAGQFEQNINCNFEGGGSSNSALAFLERWKWVIGAIVIVILFIIFIFIFSRR